MKQLTTHKVRLEMCDVCSANVKAMFEFFPGTLQL
jgi:hypothetical protein